MNAKLLHSFNQIHVKPKRLLLQKKKKGQQHGSNESLNQWEESKNECSQNDVSLMKLGERSPAAQGNQPPKAFKVNISIKSSDFHVEGE